MLRRNIRKKRRFLEDEDLNPMEGAGNIADVMLVFATGLMMSLIIFWNVDLQATDLVPAQDATEVESMNATAQEVQDTVDTEAQYQKMGTVYIDPATGKMYLIEDGQSSQPTPEQEMPAPTEVPTE